MIKKKKVRSETLDMGTAGHSSGQESRTQMKGSLPSISHESRHVDSE